MPRKKSTTPKSEKLIKSLVNDKIIINSFNISDSSDEKKSNILIKELKSQENLETKVESDLETKVESDLETKVESDLETKLESDSETKLESESKTKLESDLETKLESDLEINLELDSEIKLESNLETKLESDSETKLESDSETKLESDFETKLESDSETKLECDLEINKYGENKTKIIIQDEREEDIDKIIVKRTNNNDDVNSIINESYLKDIMIEKKKVSLDNNSVEYIKELRKKEFVLNEDIINKIISNDKENILNKYTLDDLKQLFNNLKEAVIIVQIIDGEIKFIEKKGNESRNQSVIELLIKVNNYKKLPDIQFLIFTNDFINNEYIYNNQYVFTFTRKYNYDLNNPNLFPNLFPNFNFNHWLEAKIPSYENIYNLFSSSTIEWSNKTDKIFWAGSNTNIIRKRIYESSKSNTNFNINLFENNNNKTNFIPIDEVLKYKYLLNMNGYSYGGRLNYLFLSRSCVIILKNMDKEEDFEEYFYSYFIANEDYIEIKYNKHERGEIIINRITNAIQKYNCEEIAKKCYEKALHIFKIENVYEYVYNKLFDLSQYNDIKSKLERTICYTSGLKYYNNNRLNNSNLSFYFMGKDLEINLLDEQNNIFNIKIINDNTNIKYNNINLYSKFTPYLLEETKSQFFELIFEENKFLLIINKKFNPIKIDLPSFQNKFKSNQILTENGGWWII